MHDGTTIPKGCAQLSRSSINFASSVRLCALADSRLIGPIIDIEDSTAIL